MPTDSGNESLVPVLTPPETVSVDLLTELKRIRDDTPCFPKNRRHIRFKHPREDKARVYVGNQAGTMSLLQIAVEDFEDERTVVAERINAFTGVELDRIRAVQDRQREKVVPAATVADIIRADNAISLVLGDMTVDEFDQEDVLTSWLTTQTKIRQETMSAEVQAAIDAFKQSEIGRQASHDLDAVADFYQTPGEATQIEDLVYLVKGHMTLEEYQLRRKKENLLNTDPLGSTFVEILGTVYRSLGIPVMDFDQDLHPALHQLDSSATVDSIQTRLESLKNLVTAETDMDPQRKKLFLMMIAGLENQIVKKSGDDGKSAGALVREEYGFAVEHVDIPESLMTDWHGEISEHLLQTSAGESGLAELEDQFRLRAPEEKKTRSFQRAVAKAVVEVVIARAKETNDNIPEDFDIEVRESENGETTFFEFNPDRSVITIFFSKKVPPTIASLISTIKGGFAHELGHAIQMPKVYNEALDREWSEWMVYDYYGPQAYQEGFACHFASSLYPDATTLFTDVVEVYRRVEANGLAMPDNLNDLEQLIQIGFVNRDLDGTSLKEQIQINRLLEYAEQLQGSEDPAQVRQNIIEQLTRELLRSEESMEDVLKFFENYHEYIFTYRRRGDTQFPPQLEVFDGTI